MVSPVAQSVLNVRRKVVTDARVKIGNFVVSECDLVCGNLAHIPPEGIVQHCEAALREEIVVLPRMDQEARIRASGGIDEEVGE